MGTAQARGQLPALAGAQIGERALRLFVPGEGDVAGTRASGVRTASTSKRRRTLRSPGCGSSATTPVKLTSRPSQSGGNASASRTCASRLAQRKPPARNSSGSRRRPDR